MRVLDEGDLRVIGESLRAAVEGPFFKEWEFRIIFGLDRAQVASIARVWPRVAFDDPDVEAAVQNTLNNLLGHRFGPVRARRS